jgi:4-hydroxybenzoate polyprenyltransferase
MSTAAAASSNSQGFGVTVDSSQCDDDRDGSGPSSPFARLAARVLALVLLLRSRLAGLAAYPFVLGGLLAGTASPTESAILFLMGVFHHSFACVLNDLADADDDRSNPTRSSAPLVAGSFTTTSAIGLACFILLGFVTITGLWTQPAPAVLLLAGLLGLAAYGNLYQKRSPRVSPVVMDHFFGLMMSLPIVYGTLATHGSLPVPGVCIAVAFSLNMALMNCVGGNLKDLDSDHATGARTTALEMGVRPSGIARVYRYSRGYVRYCYGLAIAGSMSLAVVGLTSGSASSSSALVVVSWLMVVAGSVWVIVDLAGLFHHRRRPSATGSEPYIYIQFLMLNVVAALSVDGSQLLVLLAACVGWLYLVAYLEVSAQYLSRERQKEPSVT